MKPVIGFTLLAISIGLLALTSGSFLTQASTESNDLLQTDEIFANPAQNITIDTLDNNLNQASASLLIPFIENIGQENNDIKFYADTFAGRVFLTDDYLTYSLNADSGSYVIHESFVFGSLIDFQGLNQHDTKVNYFIGNDPDKWYSDIPAYDGVSLGKVWNGIDVSLYAHGNNVEKIFTVNPSFDVSAIDLTFDGISKLQLGISGDLILLDDENSSIISMSAPIAFQNINGEKIDVEVDYKIIDGTTYGFTVGEYDESEPLVIDPVIQSTYLGGHGHEKSEDVAFDSDGNVFVVARTQSNQLTIGWNGEDGTNKLNAKKIPVAIDSIPDKYGVTGDVTAHHDTTNFKNPGSVVEDLIIFKVSNDLYTIQAATYLGGSANDSWPEIAIDSNDDVFVSGETESTDFPGMDANSAQQTYSDKGDVFIVKFDNDLATIHQATYFGHADGYDENLDLLINPFGSDEELFLLGETNSTSVPFYTSGFQSSHAGIGEANFVSKISNDLQTVDDSTFFASNMFDDSPSFNIHPNTGNVYVEVNTNATAANWPSVISSKITNSFNGIPTNMDRDDFGENIGHRGNADHLINQDILIASLSNDLSSVNTATYLGSDALDGWLNFVIHGGNLYMALETYGVNYPTTSGVIYEEHGLSCDITGTSTTGEGYVCNTPADSDYPYLGAWERNTAVTVMDSNLSILRSTYIGIPYANDPSDIAVDPDTDNVFITGQKTQEQESYNFLGGAIQEIHGNVASADGYIISLNNDLTNWIQSTYIGGSGVEDNLKIFFNSGFIFLSTETTSDDYPGVEYGADHTNDKATNLDFIRDDDGNKLGCCIYVEQAKRDIVISRISPDLLANTHPTFQVDSMDGLKSVDYTINLETTDNYVLGNVTNIVDENVGTVIENSPDLTHDPDDYNNLAVGLYNVTYSVTDEKGLSTSIIETINVVNALSLPTFDVLDMNGITQPEDFETILNFGEVYEVGTIQNTSADATNPEIQYTLYDNFIPNFSFDGEILDAGTYYVKYSVTDEQNSVVEIVEILTILPVSSSASVNEKNGGDGCADCTPPTFGKNKAGAQIVSEGFAFNNVSVDVIDYHTNFPLITVITNATNTVTVKIYENQGVNSISMVQFGLGMPEVGSPLNDAQTLVEISLPGEEIEMNLVDSNNLVDVVDITTKTVKCSPGYSTECLELTMQYIYRDQPKYNVMAINAIDLHRNSNTNYMNDGILVTGESINDPLTQKTSISKTSSFYPQKAGLVTLTLVDYKTDLWQDEYGYLWSTNDYGPYLVDTIPQPIKQPDPYSNWSGYNDRLHSEFNEYKNSQIKDIMKQMSEWYYKHESFTTKPDFAMQKTISLKSSVEDLDCSMLKTMDRENCKFSDLTDYEITRAEKTLEHINRLTDPSYYYEHKLPKNPIDEKDANSKLAFFLKKYN